MADSGGMYAHDGKAAGGIRQRKTWINDPNSNCMAKPYSHGPESVCCHMIVFLAPKKTLVCL